MNQSEYHRIWKKNNLDKVKESRKRYYEKNKEKNREKSLEAKRNWRKDNPEKAEQHRRSWREKNKERISEYRKEYRRKNAYTTRKHKRVSAGRWYIRVMNGLKERDGSFCRNCKTTENLTMNHIIPVIVTKKRIIHNLSLLEILCKKCNIQDYQMVVKRALNHYYSCNIALGLSSVSTLQEDDSKMVLEK